MNSFIRGFICAIIGAIIGTLSSTHLLPANYWWIGMLIGALTGAATLNPKKFMLSVVEATILSLRICLKIRVSLALIRTMQWLYFWAVQALVLMAIFFIAWSAGLFVVWNANHSIGEVFSLITVLFLGFWMMSFVLFVFGHTQKNIVKDHCAYWTLTPVTTEKKLFPPSVVTNNEAEGNVCGLFLKYTNPIAIAFWALVGCWYILVGLWKLLKLVPKLTEFLFHFSITLERLMKKELWSITTLSSALGALYGHLSHGSLLVAGTLGGLSYLLVYGTIAVTSTFAKAFPQCFWTRNE